MLSGKTSDPAAQAKAQGTAGVQGRAGSGATDGLPAAPQDPTPSAAEVVAAVPLVVHQLRREASAPRNGVGDIADSDEEDALLLGPLSVWGPGPAPSSFSLKPARKHVSGW